MIDAWPEVEFRDGFRVVMPHVAALLASLPTWTMTYEEAIKLSNDQLLRNRLNNYQRDAVQSHFTRNR